MDVTELLDLPDRDTWRSWLATNHQTAHDVWLMLGSPSDEPRITYLDAVEEALCFGWIDSTAKRHAPGVSAQRFSPRRARSRWTELNKARARRLIALGLMTDAGRTTLPDVAMRSSVSPDIEAAFRAAAAAWECWQRMPALYRAVRLSYVEEMRRTPAEFERRLANLVSKTAQNLMFGNWNDGGRLSEGD